MTLTIEEYRESLRDLYKTETDAAIKELWLKLGLAIKSVIDDGTYFIFDAADETFEKIIYEKMEEQ